MPSVRTFGAVLLVVLAAMAALVLTGCSDTKSEAPAPSSSEQPAISGEPAGFSADDIAFAFGTIAHHRQSVELAALVPDRSTTPDVVALASDITTAQEPEADLMKALLVQWNENPNDATGRGGAVAGLIDDATITRLQSLNGQEFDTLWLQSMVEHGQGAVTLAEAEIPRGTNVDAVATARRMVDSQQAQIGQMQQLLAAG